MRVDVVRRPAGRCLHADAAPDALADAFAHSWARRSDECSHNQSHAGAVATSNTATNVLGALTRADARSKPGADAAANSRAQPGADALADARVVPRRQLRRRWVRALYAVRGRILRKRAPRDELRALPRRHLQRPAWLGELRRLSVWQILGARFCGLLGVREW